MLQLLADTLTAPIETKKPRSSSSRDAGAAASPRALGGPFTDIYGFLDDASAARLARADKRLARAVTASTGGVAPNELERACAAGAVVGRDLCRTTAASWRGDAMPESAASTSFPRVKCCLPAEGDAAAWQRALHLAAVHGTTDYLRVLLERAPEAARPTNWHAFRMRLARAAWSHGHALTGLFAVPPDLAGEVAMAGHCLTFTTKRLFDFDKLAAALQQDALRGFQRSALASLCMSALIMRPPAQFVDAMTRAFPSLAALVEVMVAVGSYRRRCEPPLPVSVLARLRPEHLAQIFDMVEELSLLDFDCALQLRFVRRRPDLPLSLRAGIVLRDAALRRFADAVLRPRSGGAVDAAALLQELNVQEDAKRWLRQWACEIAARRRGPEYDAILAAFLPHVRRNDRIFGDLLDVERFDLATTCDGVVSREKPWLLYFDLLQADLGQLAEHAGVVRLLASYARACPACFAPLEGRGAATFFRRLRRHLDEASTAALFDATFDSVCTPLSLSAAKALAPRSSALTRGRVQSHARAQNDLLLFEAVSGGDRSSPSRKRHASELRRK